MAEVLLKWPSFKPYVQRLAREATDEIVRRGKTSDQTRHFEGNGNDPGVPAVDSTTRAFNLQGVKWTTVPLVRHAVTNNQAVCKWIDEENVQRRALAGASR